MNIQTMTRGALAGAVGGMVMAMWSMIMLWATHAGFWTPLNLIAHTFWRGAPLDSQFSFDAAVLGLFVHMMMSMVLGAVFAIGVQRFRGQAASLAATGMVYGLVVWMLMQYVVWLIVDAEAAEAFTPWVFGIGHAMFGATTGLVVGALGKATAGENVADVRGRAQ